ncbi:MAG: BPL-N domain-containing protein [Candidatus Thermoplasmatota archaeon]|nr:BPL-N domain-containing protein [Candidatus Thermoplasmatota archaeon]
MDYMHYRIIATGCILFLLLSFTLPQESFSSSDEKTVKIKVAVYGSTVKIFAEEVKQTIEYSWENNGTKYEIIPVIIGRNDVIGKGKNALTNENFDVFIVPGISSPYFDAYDLRWRKSVKEFVENGGGYIGICGGANLASMGFQEKLSPNTVLDLSVLKIANVYVNDQQAQEWQYLWKSNWEYGLPPIQVYISEVKNPITEGFCGGYRNIRYGGGPGMYPAYEDNEKCGEVIPLAIYAEEPMEVAPLHYWKWNGRWEIAANVTTDIKGQWASIATTYGNGKVVLFGPHPEKKTFFGGHVEEFPVRANTRFTWFIYNWSDGILSEESYNWWMLRRSVAWVTHHQIPPASKIAVFAEEPEDGMYINGRKIMEMKNTVIIGSATVKARAIDGREIAMYVDGELKDLIHGNSYSNMLSIGKGTHVIRIETWNNGERAIRSFPVIGT